MSKGFRRRLKSWGTQLRRTLFLREKRRAQRRRSKSRPEEPKQTVFVCGMMRSGTNMVMDTLEQSTDTEVFHESDPRAFDRFVMKPPDVIRRLIDDSYAPCVVVKALLESHRVDGLLAEFAPSRAVWVYRDVDDSVNSQLVNFKSTPESVARMATDPSFVDWRTEGLTDRLRALLSEHYREGMERASSAALFWLLRNLSFFEQGFDRRDDVYLLRYEDCVTHPAETFEQLFAWLGLEFHTGVTSRVFATSIRKNAAPNIDAGIRELCRDVTARFDALREARA